MNKRWLMVPMRLDALRVQDPIPACAASANFSQLPFITAQGDQNTANAYLSETILSAPFQDGTPLDVGVHLHWSLPAALRRSRTLHDDGGAGADDPIAFPAVPTFWRIIRTVEGSPDLSRSWIVESDYVHPVDTGPGSGAISFPVRSGMQQGHNVPFRFMGRCLNAKDWSALNKPYETLKDVTLGKHPLTAIGSGDPKFSAFYPDCHSVFGLHDQDSLPPDMPVIYHVIGWYRDADEDLLQSALTDPAIIRAIDGKDRSNTRAHAAALEEVFDWVLPKDLTSVPEHSLYYARLTLKESSEKTFADGKTRVAIGNTASEALATHLAHSEIASTAQLEDQIEALGLMHELHHLRVDTGPKFEEARHSRGFRAMPAQQIYRIRTESTADEGSDIGHPATRADALRDAPHYPDLAQDLADLNQTVMEQAAAEAKCQSMRRQTFADWSKYMVCAYPPPDQAGTLPDIDEARYLIETHDIAQVTDLADQAAKFATRADHLKTVLEAKLVGLSQALATDGCAIRAVLDVVAAPRFWQPNEPVVMVIGPDAEATARFSKDQPTQCWPVWLETENLLGEGEKLAGLIDGQLDTQGGALEPNAEPPFLGAQTSDGAAWHGFMLDWEVALWPLEAAMTSDGHGSHVYPDSFLHDHYVLDQNAVDLRQTAKATAEAARPSTFTGTSLLSPQAKPTLRQDIDKFLKIVLWPLFRDIHPDETRSFDKARSDVARWFSGLRPDDLIKLRFDHAHAPTAKSEPEAMQRWYDSSGQAHTDRFIKDALAIFERLGPDLHTLGQALTGFNAALLGQRQTMQLAVADPLAFRETAGASSYRAFASDTATAVGRFNRVAPEPMSGFSPIRNGRMRLARLRLVDTFGRTRDIAQDAVAKADTGATLSAGQLEGEAPGEVLLPPRLAQPARLTFRWLSAAHGPATSENTGEVETNAHPDTAPICGWLVANALDNSVMTFDADGQALGSIDINGEWRARPGGPNSTAPPSDMHPVLRGVITWLLRPKTLDEDSYAASSPALIEPFLSAVESAQANINPANFLAHTDLALLMGRPLAIVRATTALDLQGLPALNPDWGPFSKALRYGHDWHQSSAMINDVRIPVRLGEHRQLNDGLVGYWEEPEPGQLGHTFISPQSNATWLNTEIAGRHIQCSHDGTAEDNRLQFDLTLSGAAKAFTMLVDPNCVVHATTGILPTKSIALPVDQTAAALEKIEVSFLTAPVLTPPGDGIALNLPREQGYEWSWRYQSKDGFHQTTDIHPTETTAAFTGKSSLQEGWLVLNKAKRS